MPLCTSTNWCTLSSISSAILRWMTVSWVYSLGIYTSNAGQFNLAFPTWIDTMSAGSSLGKKSSVLCNNWPWWHTDMVG